MDHIRQVYVLFYGLGGLNHKASSCCEVCLIKIQRRTDDDVLCDEVSVYSYRITQTIHMVAKT